MANKTSGNQGSSGEVDDRVPRASRKVIGKTSAPYERKAEEGGEEKKPATEGQPAEGEKAEAAAAPADAAKPEPVKGGRKDAAARKEAKEAPRAADAPAAAAAPTAPAATEAPSAPAAASPPEPGSAPVTTPPRPAPPQAGDFAPPPELDATAEFAELLPPRFIQKWDPSTPAPPPAKAPPGDSRSFRRRGPDGEEFVLIYRAQTFLVRRSGKVGLLGTWTITDYPHVGAAAHAYAQQCSELTAAGFRDLR